ncbi:MAG: membrane protein insertase YidC [Ruminococcus sp.]|nr:membrane protein insertase YidC [Ruminococcus sp.]
MISFIGGLLGKLMSLIFNIIKDYGLSIIVFTLVTKVILLPLNLVTQKNSINMARLMPEENALKIKYIDDKDKLADEQLALYKRYNYKPILGMVPLLIQIPLVLGLVYVIYHPLSYVVQLEGGVISQLKDWMAALVPAEMLEENSYQPEIIRMIKQGALVPEGLRAAGGAIRGLNTDFLGIDLSLTPSFKDNYILLLIPLLSGLSAWLLCYVQNKINILQVSAGFWNKLITTVFLIAFSTYFAFLVPAGVGLYWIFGNLFSIPFMYLVNLIIPPQKYVDLSYIKLMNEQKAEKEKIHKKYVSRERADYKRFFSVKDMQLMIYSESNGFYKYFKGMIDYICENSDIQIHYVTSDPEDNIFNDPREQIHPYYVSSDKFLIPLFMKLDCDMCVMTMPDLEKYHIKRSRIRNDIEYVFVSHGMGSVALTFRKGALNYFDTVFCPGKDTIDEIRDTEELYGTPKKRLVETGYTLIDEMIEKYDSEEHPKNDPPRILIAPSWQPDNIIDLCVDELIDRLSETEYNIILRPHPQQVRHEPEKFKVMKEKYADRKNVEIQTDFSSNNPIMESDILITDWSDISWEFAFVTRHPVLFINTPMKVMNPEYDKIKTRPINITLREVIGRSIDPDKLEGVNDLVKYMLDNRESFEETITKTRSERIFNIGKSRILYGRYVIKTLESRK